MFFFHPLDFLKKSRCWAGSPFEGGTGGISNLAEELESSRPVVDVPLEYLINNSTNHQPY